MRTIQESNLPSTSQTFSQKIKEARENFYIGKRKKRGLTLKAAAKKIGISSVYLWQLENEERRIPNALIVPRMEQAYKFEPGELTKLLLEEHKLSKKSV